MSLKALGLSVRFGSAIAIAGAAVAVANARYLRQQETRATAQLALESPETRPPGTRPTVSLLVPMRNEARNVDGCLSSLIGVAGVSEILVIDDESTDNTAALIANFTSNHESVRQIPNDHLGVPDHWLGKNWACVRLAREAEGDYLVFVDADVRLAADAVETALAYAHADNLDMVSPYPRQETPTSLSRLIQPLLQWSWMTFVPLSISNSTQRPSMAIGNGQFLLINHETYESVGGHAAVSNDVTEDIGLARLLRRCGHRTAVVNGADLATCTMYENDSDLLDGYTKSIAHALGGSKRAFATVGLLKLGYVVPPLAMIFGRGSTRRWGAVGYGAAVAGRVVVARTTGQRVWPDSLAQPLSIWAFALLTTRSISHTGRGLLTWRGRSVGPSGSS